MADNSVFQEVQAALLNSECDPHEAGAQALCALYSFVATELEDSRMHIALTLALNDLRSPVPTGPGEEHVRKELRKRVLCKRVDDIKRRK